MRHRQSANQPKAAHRMHRLPEQPVSVELLCRLSRLFTYLLRRLDWETLRFADKRRLERALARLESDVALARTITRAGAGKKDG